MSKPPSAIQKLTQLLLTHESARLDSANGDVDRAVQACQKLREPLTKLAGTAGFSSLLSRALALSKRQAPALNGLQVEADGSLVGSNGVLQDVAVAKAERHGGEVLVAELLHLLVTLIGAPLTLSMVREAWPDVPAEHLTLRTEDNS
jgi:hypothetical protein